MKIALLFPGQGSQFPLMGKDFYESNEVYKKVFDDILEENHKEFFKAWESNDINLTKNSQPLLLANQIGIYELIKENYEVKYQATAGFSLGEYSALYASKHIDFENVKKAVLKRSSLMSTVKSNLTTKVVLGLSYFELKDVQKEFTKEEIILKISNYNLEKQILVSFDPQKETKIVEKLKNYGAKRILDINLSGPFHTNVYQEVAKEYHEYLKTLPFMNDKSKIDLYLNVTGEKLRDEDLKEMEYKQIYNGVLWYKLIKNMIADGIDTFIELGSKSVVSSMIKKIDRKVNIISIENIEDLNKLEEIWKKKLH